MKKYLKGTRQAITDESIVIYLEYYLIESIYYEKEKTKTAYGIEVLMKNNEYYETDIVEKITNQKEKVLEMINKIIGNMVTPVGLIYAIDELY
ncbi:MAG: DUF6514 family protein [Vallitalea sp.]|jgi:hypothetical protein|nr:DUF6514 family protein [Vallitalea sp.]